MFLFSPYLPQNGQGAEATTKEWPGRGKNPGSHKKYKMGPAKGTVILPIWLLSKHNKESHWVAKTSLIWKKIIFRIIRWNRSIFTRTRHVLIAITIMFINCLGILMFSILRDWSINILGTIILIISSIIFLRVMDVTITFWRDFDTCINSNNTLLLAVPHIGGT